MMREKRRYILVESSVELDLHDRNFETEFYTELLHNIGEINYYRANPKIMKYPSNKRFILKCSLARYKETLLAITFIKKVGGKDMGFYTINASGTIMALQKAKKESSQTG
jgi:RNase P/RNase MRP subunit POP5